MKSFLLIYLFSFIRAVSGEVCVNTDKYTIIGFSYGKSGVPGPYQGVWKHAYFEPNPNSTIKQLKYIWDQSPKQGSNEIVFEWDIISSNGVNAKTSFKVDIKNWSNGWLDENERNDSIKYKTLLHYHQIPEAKFSGPIPLGLSIEKHTIGMVNNESVELVIYRADNLEVLKKYFPMTEYELWGLPEKWYSSMLKN
jgi:hypothetical protein